MNVSCGATCIYIDLSLLPPIIPFSLIRTSNTIFGLNSSKSLLVAMDAHNPVTNDTILTVDFGKPYQQHSISYLLTFLDRPPFGIGYTSTLQSTLIQYLRSKFVIAFQPQINRLQNFIIPSLVSVLPAIFLIPLESLLICNTIIID